MCIGNPFHPFLFLGLGVVIAWTLAAATAGVLFFFAF